MKKIGLLRGAWSLLTPFWGTRKNLYAYGLLVLVLALNLGRVWMSLWFNAWYARFYDALQNYDEAAFLHELILFLVVAVVAILVAIYRQYFQLWLTISWRKWMTQQTVDAWLDRRAYYRMQIDGTRPDNPDQRIAEDVGNFVSSTLSLGLGFITQVANLIGFSIVLWTISGPLTVAVFGADVTIPGYMIWVALAYAIVGTWIMHLIGRPLIGVLFEQQKVEANFRFGLVRFRENVEGVALYSGEEGERRELTRRFAAVAANYWRMIWRYKWMTTFSSIYGQVTTIFPFIVAAPRYFSREIGIGQIIQIAQGFGQVQDSLSWFIDSYASWADYKATIDRLAGFRAAIAAARQHPDDPLGTVPATGSRLTVPAGIEIGLPDGTTLARTATSLSVEPADKVLVTGRSGSGKSTLFRALAGLWPFGQGRIATPANGGRVLFLPQRPYLPLGSLRAVLAYPDTPESLSDDAARATLDAVELGTLSDELDHVDAWARRLSPGEQQRLAIARALLYRPDWLFLDEPTSALDPEASELLFGLLSSKLPGTALVTISHDPEAKRFHDRLWRIDGAAGARRLAEVALTPSLAAASGTG